MKRSLWNIVAASMITLIAYIALYSIWGAILNELENPALKSFLIALMTTVAFGFFLLYMAKIRKSVGENEVVADYKESSYKSVAHDFQLIIKRESKLLICIVAIVLICFVLNTLDSLVFEKKVISLPTAFFAPMCLFSTVFSIPAFGYALSAVLDCVTYIVFLLIYRKKKYDYWMKSQGGD